MINVGFTCYVFAVQFIPVYFRSYPAAEAEGACASDVLILRGTIVNRTYGIHKNLYV